tara:strand:- start:57 stop:449 length:393 start_codon:yes stop_codon:yes gene_type:complete
MPGVALKDEESSVACTDGVIGTVCATSGAPSFTPIKWYWNTDTTQKSNAGSSDVFAEGTGVVRKDDAMKAHANGDPCVASATNHTPAVSTFSSTVFANGKNIARIGDKYNSESSQDHEITTGATTVFAGG